MIDLILSREVNVSIDISLNQKASTSAYKLGDIKIMALILNLGADVNIIP